MHDMQMVRFSKLTKMLARSKSAIIRDINKGLFVQQIPIGVRCAVFPLLEVEAIVRARIAGKNESEIRALVADLMAKRSAE